MVKVSEHPGKNPQQLIVHEYRGPQSPLGEPPDEGFLGIWPEAPYYYIFFDREPSPSIYRWLEKQHGWILNSTYQLDYEQWQQVSAADCRVGPFVIRSAGAPGTGSYSKDEIPICLNPGVVFGSGLHASTKGCLLAVADLFDRYPVRSVVDLGTGTGILALACAVLGAARVRAVDCNPLAIRVAQKNVRANGLENVVELLVARELKILRKPSDLLLMNLEWPSLRGVLRSGDWSGYPLVVLSGFLDSQWRDLQPLIPPARPVLLRYALDGWLTVVLGAFWSKE